MLLLYSKPSSSHITAAPSTTTNNKLTNSILASKINKRYLHFSKKPSSTSSLSVKCKKAEVPSSSEPVEELIYDLNDLGLSPTLLPNSDVKREEFPRDFLFGASTSAIQVLRSIYLNYFLVFSQSSFRKNLRLRMTFDVVVNSTIMQPFYYYNI